MIERENPIQVGDDAPQFSLKTSNDEDFRFEARDKPTIVMFMREYTCIQCRNHVATLVRQYNEIQDKGADIVVIGGGNVRQARTLAQTFKPQFPILADEDRAVYRAFGLHKSFFIQRNATLVIDTEGKVAHISESLIPGAGFDYKGLIEALERLADRQAT